MINEDSDSERWVKAALYEFEGYIDYHDPAYGNILVRKFEDGRIVELHQTKKGFVEKPLMHKKIPIDLRDLVTRRMKAEIAEYQEMGIPSVYKDKQGRMVHDYGRGRIFELIENENGELTEGRLLPPEIDAQNIKPETEEIKKLREFIKSQKYIPLTESEVENLRESIKTHNLNLVEENKPPLSQMDWDIYDLFLAEHAPKEIYIAALEYKERGYINDGKEVFPSKTDNHEVEELRAILTGLDFDPISSKDAANLYLGIIDGAENNSIENNPFNDQDWKVFDMFIMERAPSEVIIEVLVKKYKKIGKLFEPDDGSSDPNDPYSYPGTRVLKNNFGIRDDKLLQEAERRLTSVRMAQLITNGFI